MSVMFKIRMTPELKESILGMTPLAFRAASDPFTPTDEEDPVPPAERIPDPSDDAVPEDVPTDTSPGAEPGDLEVEDDDGELEGGGA